MAYFYLTQNSIMKNISKIFFICFVLLILSSCSAEFGQPISATEYTNLLLKAKEFILFSSLILNQSNKFYGQVISRIYYSYYTLSRVHLINKSDGNDDSSHSDIFPKSSKDPIEKFGFSLKQKRCKYDYDPVKINDINNQIEDLKYVFENKDLFNKQIKHIRETLNENPIFSTEDEDDRNNKILDEIEKSLENFMLQVKEITDKHQKQQLLQGKK